MHIWLRSEPLNNCAINYPISHHINASTLRKTVNYAKNKGTAGYPIIEYSIWRYIACNKMSIPEHVAWMYFETFFFISNYGNRKNIDMDLEISKCKSTEEIEKCKETKRVDLYQFILHLYIQQFYSIDLKSSVMSKEEWPVNRNESNDRRKAKSMDELNFMNFITKNLEEIISLYLPERTLSQNEILSEEIIQTLNFILEGSVDNMQTVLQFNNEGKLYVKNLVNFLKNYLEINPFGLHACLRSGRRISPSYIGGSNDPIKIGKIVTNAPLAPKGESALYIDKCIYTNVYVLQPVKSCTIKKCRKSLLFIGPVQRSLTIDSCMECVIVAACRRLIIRNCSACTFHLLTPSSPILLSGCDNIVFAPYNSSYPTIEEDAFKSGLSEHLNQWDKPIVVTHNQSFINGSHWSLMNPRDFYPIGVPVELASKNSKTTGSELVSKNNDIFGVLPSQYELELNKRLKQIEENLGLVQSSGLNYEQRMMLQKCIESSFKESLQLSGEQRQLDHLSIIVSNSNNTNITNNISNFSI